MSLSREEREQVKKEFYIKVAERKAYAQAVKECRLKRRCLKKEMAWFRRKMRKKAYLKTEKGRAIRNVIKKRYLKNNPHAREAKREWRKKWMKTEKGREAQRRKNQSSSQKAMIAARKAKKRVLDKTMTDFDKFVYKEAYLLKQMRRELLRAEWHIDHTIPISKGGTNAYNNIEVVPAKWNLDKSNFHTYRFFRRDNEKNSAE
jgi:5-methylcytosine-specific restriction endonuclease McrA